MAINITLKLKKSEKLSAFFCLIIVLHLLGAVESVGFGLFQKRYPYPGSVREIHCRYSRTNKIENCQHGSYIDECKRETCYNGVGEKCDTTYDTNNQFGLCAVGLQCVCNKCLGCVKNQCSLELDFGKCPSENVHRDAIIYDDRDNANSIKRLYDVDSTYSN